MVINYDFFVVKDFMHVYYEGVRIFEFDGDSRLVTRVSARNARVGNGFWLLDDVLVTHWPVSAAFTFLAVALAIISQSIFITATL